ncbi:MAG: hypothetical protein R6U41_02990 [Desulfosalsimonas sp.]|uniref:hypothetical protein n=1 Tax=Desulfosalsimonas sp. TaxID=3073848 RepID=UPI003970D613
MRYVKRLVLVVAVAAFLAGPLAQSAMAADYSVNSGEPSGATMVVDMFAARPLGFVSLIFGTTTFVVSLPFSAWGGNTGEAFENLMVPPAMYTFNRPLGDFR